MLQVFHICHTTWTKLKKRARHASKTRPSEETKPRRSSCASLRSGPAHGHLRRELLRQNLQWKKRCPESIPWCNPAFNTCHKNPSVWTQLFGEKVAQLGKLPRQKRRLSLPYPSLLQTNGEKERAQGSRCWHHMPRLDGSQQARSEVGQGSDRLRNHSCGRCPHNSQLHCPITLRGCNCQWSAHTNSIAAGKQIMVNVWFWIAVFSCNISVLVGRLHICSKNPCIFHACAGWAQQMLHVAGHVVLDGPGSHTEAFPTPLGLEHDQRHLSGAIFLCCHANDCQQ